MSLAESAPAWTRLFSGPNADVWASAECQAEMEELDDKCRAKIVATMEDMFCAMERPEDISPKRFNPNEGRHLIDKKECLLQAFKARRGRVYGVTGSVNGKRAFFASRATVKNQNKADPKELERAANRLVGVTNEVTGAKL